MELTHLPRPNPPVLSFERAGGSWGQSSEKLEQIFTYQIFRFVGGAECEGPSAVAAQVIMKIEMLISRFLYKIEIRT